MQTDIFIFRYFLFTILFLSRFEGRANPVKTASNIHTVQLYKTGWSMSQPIIHLHSQEQLSLSFDDFATNTKNYQYTIIHCNTNWEESGLMSSEYINGFMPNAILNYEYSFNTTFDYVHYTLDFPNSDVQLMLSGNYIIKVFELGNEESPVLTRPFYVTESVVNIVPRVKYTASASLREYMQEVSFNIFYPNFTIGNPREDVDVVIQQNGRWDNEIKGLKPLFIRDQELSYDYSRETLFDGGNEYRWLDVRSTRFAPEYVEGISFHPPHFYYTMYPDENRGDGPYFYKEDFNGKYYIDTTNENRDPDIEGDYVYVHFKLQSDDPMPDSKVYVSGSLNDWQLNKRNEMVYNAQTQMYECTLLLKQGFYNYQYLVVKNNQLPALVAPFEGSFGQTENDYTIYVYYHSFSDNYERLIGVDTFNSLKYNVGNQ